jgi:predicted transcriptional regulator
MPDNPKGNDVRTLAVRVSPDFHAQLSMVAKVDEMSLVDLMMQALENHVAARREAPDFQAKVQQALEEAEAQMQRTRAMLLGTLPEGATPSEPGADAPATGRGRRKDETSG